MSSSVCCVCTYVIVWTDDTIITFSSLSWRATDLRMSPAVPGKKADSRHTAGSRVGSGGRSCAHKGLFYWLIPDPRSANSAADNSVLIPGLCLGAECAIKTPQAFVKLLDSSVLREEGIRNAFSREYQTARALDSAMNTEIICFNHWPDVFLPM